MIKLELLKKATPKALQDVNSLMAQMSLTRTPPRKISLTKFKLMLSQPGLYIFAAQSESKRIIGMVSFYLVRLPSGLHAVVEDLIVDKPYRHFGIGRLLMEPVIGLARALRARHLSLRTNSKRVDAMKLYEALGFKKSTTNFYRINLYK